jgi:hypothetical protein
MYDPDMAPNFVAEFRDYMPPADYADVRFVAQRMMSLEDNSLLVDDPDPPRSASLWTTCVIS